MSRKYDVEVVEESWFLLGYPKVSWEKLEKHLDSKVTINYLTAKWFELGYSEYQIGALVEEVEYNNIKKQVEKEVQELLEDAEWREANVV